MTDNNHLPTAGQRILKLIADHPRFASSLQKEIAQELGVSPQAMRTWKSGQHRMRYSNVQRAAELLGIHADDLLSGVQPSSVEGGATLSGKVETVSLHAALAVLHAALTLVPEARRTQIGEAMAMWARWPDSSGETNRQYVAQLLSQSGVPDLLERPVDSFSAIALKAAQIIDQIADPATQAQLLFALTSKLEEQRRPPGLNPPGTGSDPEAP